MLQVFAVFGVPAILLAIGLVTLVIAKRGSGDHLRPGE
ncbi:hypothetical protein C7477_102213 [Phyllobacterium leguminum]|uniref:Uncharacterized protein n=1 Tax=Phyllobacterium leguminum TaxID=314237 RepID=A0A318TF24_9HYPH|nr:hypothetical protein C7477_102213 [Phyllobacterium leguminum]